MGVLLLGVLFFWGFFKAGKVAARYVHENWKTGKDTKIKAAEQHLGGSLTPRQKSAVVRDHTLGWWGREIREKFPVHKAGLQTGWEKHKTTLAEREAHREEARTAHLEARAAIPHEEHRKRRQAAMLIIDKAGAPEKAPAPQEPVEEGTGTDAAVEKPPTTDVATDEPPTQPIPVIPSSNGNGAAPMPADTTQGEATYNESIRLATEIQSEADAMVHDIRFERMKNMLDSFAALDLDPGTLAAAADVDDKLRAQQKAAQETSDEAAAFAAGLQRDHGGYQEATDNSRVEVARKEFYRG